MVELLGAGIRRRTWADEQSLDILWRWWVAHPNPLGSGGTLPVVRHLRHRLPRLPASDWRRPSHHIQSCYRIPLCSTRLLWTRTRTITDNGQACARLIHLLRNGLVLACMARLVHPHKALKYRPIPLLALKQILGTKVLFGGDHPKKIWVVDRDMGD